MELFPFSGNWLTGKHLTRVLSSPSLPDSTGEDVFYLPVDAAEVLLGPGGNFIPERGREAQDNLLPGAFGPFDGLLAAFYLFLLPLWMMISGSPEAKDRKEGRGRSGERED